MLVDGEQILSCDNDSAKDLQSMDVLLRCNTIFDSQRCEAQQSSTNGSHSANNACDDDMETYSLTMDSKNQTWSMTLKRVHEIFWIFLSISCGRYDVHIQLNTSKIRTCKQIEIACNITSKTKVVTCDPSGVVLGNKIILRRVDDGAIQINEVKSIDFTTLKKIQVKTQSVDLNGKDAFDGNLDSHILTEERKNATWYMTMEEIYAIKWILISIRGGNYELHITNEGVFVSNESTICSEFNLHNPSTKYQIIVECEREMKGNSITIKRTDKGPIRLFEVHPILCPALHYGINCAKCKKACLSCNPISGVCKQCRGPFFGDYCQHQCPTTCLNTTCDQVTGSCDSCREGNNGENCELQMSIDYRRTEVVSSTNSVLDVPKEERDNKEDSDEGSVLVVVLSVLVVLLLLVISILFVSKWNKQKSKTDKEKGFSANYHRSESRNESELEEIPQNETDYVEEEERVTVEYCNLTSQMVSLEQFIRELPEKKRNGILEKEFDDLPNGLLESYSNALKTSNRTGNRYKGIYPYDYNRVKLVKTDADKDDDYVNASYIHGYNRERTYIATQGPFNPKTLQDFWTVIWQNDSTIIVMLTSLYEGDKMKCLQYWPDTELDIGPYTIKMDTEHVYDHYILRYLVVQYQEEEKRVTQYHFTAWPDNSVPEDLTSLICFRNLVRNGLTPSDGPIVVHCSAGIGRTGTFIALDYLLEEGAAEQMIDVKGYVASLRHQRGKSIQTCEQYLFLHDSLNEGFTGNSVHNSVLSVL
ncbi:uncharacterized protein LOC133194910 [Saccostrea echinata]|uniref:uncharacterized protein LOC133194910 n=1 Tax=Saccostrea echinata TaxID=191078 RepID=UPI002A801603|nr:uncharacterized protein LOC133194910 [Saccostrea echinata]